MTDLSGPGVRALLIGTGTHRPGAVLPEVRAVAATLSEIRGCLVDICGVDPHHVEMRLDPADSGELDGLIRSMSRDADRLFLLYYVGHGLIDQRGRLHLATALTTDPYRIEHGRSLPFDVVKDAVFGAAGRGRDRANVIVFDCCYSGRITADVGGPAQAGFAQTAVRGTYVMTSAASNEEAWAPLDETYTAFSGGLIQLLHDGDPDGPSSFTLDGVYERLSRMLRDRGAPRPRRHAEDSAGRLVLAANPAYQRPRAMPPRAPGGAPALDKPPCPYKDLHAFDVDDHALFFGRNRLVAQLLERVKERVSEPGVQVVTGPSGVGKSSLLRAGMMHGIAVGKLDVPGSAAWDQLPPITPGSDPLLSLATALAPHLASHWPGDEPAATLRRKLLVSPELTADLVRQLRPGETNDARQRVVLVVDQFEEIFACRDEKAIAGFVRALCAAAAPSGQGGSAAALVVLGLRSDFLGACAAYPELNRALGAAAFVVGPMSRDELRQAIVGPTEAAGLGMEDGLVEVLLRDADPSMTVGRSDVGGQGILPLLSHALYATWQRCDYDSWRDGNGRLQQGWSLKTAHYQATGGIQGALSASADAVYEGLDQDIQRHARHILLGLVQSLTVADAPIDTRRRAHRDEFRSGPDERHAADAVIGAFAAARLLTVDGDYVEIAHEALLNAWARLRGWIDAGRERLLVRRQVLDAALTWRAEGKHPSGLLQGPRLAAARALLSDQSGGMDLAGDDAEFLAASIRRARRAARRPYEVIAALIVLLALAISGGLYTLGQRDLARRQGQAAQIGQLVAESRAVSQTDPRTSLLLALDAYHQEATPLTYAQLLTAVTQTRYAGILLGHASAIQSVAYRPGGGILASGDDNGTVIIWNAAKQIPLASFKARSHVWDLAFSSNGETLAVGTASGFIQLWNLANPAHPTRLTTLSALGNHDDPGYTRASVAFTPHGDALAATDDQHTLTVWNAADPAHPALLSRTDVPSYPKNDADGDVAFSPDGRTLLIGNDFNTVAALWDMTDRSHPRYLSALPTTEGAGTYAVAFSPNGHMVATEAGFTAYTYLWDVSNRSAPTLISTMTGQGGKVVGLAFSPDGSKLATASQDGTTWLWNIAHAAHPTQLASLRGQKGSVNTVAFSPNGHAVATGSDDRTLVLWNADTNVNTPAATTLPGGHGIDAVTALAYGDRILAVGNEQGTVELWDTTDPAHPGLLATYRLPRPKLLGQTAISGLAFSPNGRTLALATEDSVTLWDLKNPDSPSLLTVLPDQAHGAVAFNPAGTIVAAVDGKNRILLLNVKNPGVPRAIGATAAFPGQNSLDAVTFSPDNHIMAIGQVANAAGGLALYDITNPRAPRHLVNLDTVDPTVYAVAFSPNGAILASTTEAAGVMLWNVADPPHPIHQTDLTGNTGFTAGVAFGPEHTLATSGYDQTTILWNLTDPAHPVQTVSLTDQVGAIGPIEFSPDGRTLATASADSTTVLWDVTGLTAIMRQPVLSACRITSPGNMPANWAADAPGVPYQPGCPQAYNKGRNRRIPR